MPYSKLTGERIKTVAARQPGVYVIAIKGKHIGRIGMIKKVWNHAWYEVMYFPDEFNTVHKDFFKLASEAEIEAHLHD